LHTAAHGANNYVGALKVKSAQDKKASGGLHSASESSLPSGWFGDFSQDESTYAFDGLDSSRSDPEFAVKYGRDPSLEPRFDDSQVFKSEFFHESQSGGPKAAWETNYPSLSSSIAGNRGIKENSWRQTPMGWVNDYQPMPDGGVDVTPASADWFDNSIRNIDGFGRKMQPSMLNGARLLGQGWLERSVNTTVRCETAGCTAASSLQLFDVSKEEGQLCHLSIVIHPTDYDDDYSREHVEYWKVNGYIANRGCNPKARGCNKTAQSPLYPCLNGLNVDKLVDSKGTIVIEGKNSKLVDECAVDDKYLLSGVAMATCMVKNKTQDLPTTTTTMFSMSDLLGESVLKCDTPGCTAETKVYFSPAIALNGGKCTMDVTMHETDYDDPKNEMLEFLQVEGTNVTLSGNGKSNPCTSGYKNKTLLQTERVFSAVKSFDVTSLVQKSHPLGALSVKGKISSQVDECGYNGNLLYGNVTVKCVAPTKFAASPPASQLLNLHAPSTLPGKPASLLKATDRLTKREILR
jgi:hypothetical protein